MHIYIYIYICVCACIHDTYISGGAGGRRTALGKSRKGDDTVGNPHRAQTSQFELLEPIILL